MKAMESTTENANSNHKNNNNNKNKNNNNNKTTTTRKKVTEILTTNKPSVCGPKEAKTEGF